MFIVLLLAIAREFHRGFNGFWGGFDGFYPSLRGFV